MTDRIIPLTPAGKAPGGGRPPIFERIGIIGLGLIGGSIAIAAREIWPAGLVVGVDSNEVLERAVARHAIDVAASDLTIVREADLIILAAPVLQNIELLAGLADVIDKPVVVTDVGSTKRRIVEAATRLPAHLTFIGGHPLGGSTRAGIEGARPDLFAGRPWLFTPSGDGSREGLSRLFEFVTALGAVPRTMNAEAHDHLLAFISHLPQLAASALMAIVGDVAGEEGLKLSGRGLQDTTRLAGSSADIWRDICRTNADEIRPALDALIDLLRQIRTGLNDSETLDRVFETAGRWRSLLVGREENR